MIQQFKKRPFYAILIPRMPKKQILIAAGLVSLAAQGIFFFPAQLAFIYGTERMLLITVLFVFAVLLYFLALKQYDIPQRDWVFPILQAITILGIFFLRDGS